MLRNLWNRILSPLRSASPLPPDEAPTVKIDRGGSAVATSPFSNSDSEPETPLAEEHDERAQEAKVGLCVSELSCVCIDRQLRSCRPPPAQLRSAWVSTLRAV